VADVYGTSAGGEADAVSLRSTPITRAVTLPDGREITVRVAVPDDPYIAKKELDTVALELLEGGRVIATLNTVLGAADEEAASALAREVADKLAAGELEPTAGALEPLADALR
jgi:hypothetical protein